jgi:hypothetical protein
MDYLLYNTNQQVRRNIRRFPEDFMFQLTKQEFTNLISQFVTSSWGGTRKLPFAFTELGATMLSSVLNSDVAIEKSISIIINEDTRMQLELVNEALAKLQAGIRYGLN